MTPMDIRYKLLSDYLDELQSIKGLPPLTPAEKLRFYTEATTNPCTQWLDIREGNTLIGFLLIGTPPNCHPNANIYIEEAYIAPSHRNRGHMTTFATAFIAAHPGTYCLFILKNNHAAKRFWQRVFESLDYAPCFLADVDAADEHCTQYGYKPQKAIPGS